MAEPEQIARRFHEAYERLAPSYGYKTREASAVPWGDVPEANKALMIAVAAEVSADLADEHIAEMRAMCEANLADAKRRRSGKIGSEFSYFSGVHDVLITVLAALDPPPEPEAARDFACVECEGGWRMCGHNPPAPEAAHPVADLLRNGGPKPEPHRYIRTGLPGTLGAPCARCQAPPAAPIHSEAEPEPELPADRQPERTFTGLLDGDVPGAAPATGAERYFSARMGDPEYAAAYHAAVEDLLDASSLGAPDVKEAMRRVPDETVREVLRRVRKLEAEVAPVTVPCPECYSRGTITWATATSGGVFTCKHCGGSGVVPNTGNNDG